MSDKPLCEICGEPMPDGEEMFKYHGYSCNCPKPPLEKVASSSGGSVSCEAHRPDIEKLKDEFSKMLENIGSTDIVRRLDSTYYLSEQSKDKLIDWVIGALTNASARGAL